MGYDLEPNNKNLDTFHFGAFSWPILLEACGYLYPAVQKRVQWEMAGNAGDIDKRFKNCEYPPILSNDGFYVTTEEAKIMARMAENFVAIESGKPDGKRIRDDFLSKFEQFAKWAKQSGGFKIW